MVGLRYGLEQNSLDQSRPQTRNIFIPLALFGHAPMPAMTDINWFQNNILFYYHSYNLHDYFTYDNWIASQYI